MSEYFSILNQLKKTHIIDFISVDYLDEHPRGVIFLRRYNEEPYPYNVNTIIHIIEKGNRRDPFTREPLSLLTKKRAYLYKECLRLFPRYIIDINFDYKSLFYSWLSTHYKGDNFNREHLYKIQIEAQCFLQIEYIIDIFNAKFKEEINRQSVNTYLSNKPIGFWMLRRSSIQSTQYEKAYALSIKTGEDHYKHIAIVHKIGDGVYWKCDISRSSVVTPHFKYDSVYPTIIHLLEDNVIKNTDKCGLNECFPILDKLQKVFCTIPTLSCLSATV